MAVMSIKMFRVWSVIRVWFPSSTTNPIIGVHMNTMLSGRHGWTDHWWWEALTALFCSCQRWWDRLAGPEWCVGTCQDEGHARQDGFVLYKEKLQPQTTNVLRTSPSFEQQWILCSKKPTKLCNGGEDNYRILSTNCTLFKGMNLICSGGMALYVKGPSTVSRSCVPIETRRLFLHLWK